MDKQISINLVINTPTPTKTPPYLISNAQFDKEICIPSFFLKK
jgi:hypothetical protein